MTNAVQMKVTILRKALSLLNNPLSHVIGSSETEKVLSTVFSHVRSGVFDSCVCVFLLDYSESHSMFNVLVSSVQVHLRFCAHGFHPGAQSMFSLLSSLRLCVRAWIFMFITRHSILFMFIKSLTLCVSFSCYSME